MKPVLMFLVLALAVVEPLSLIAERPAENSNLRAGEASDDGSAVTMSQRSRAEAVPQPFARGATMESASTLGAQFQIAINLNRNMNLRNSYNLLIWKKWAAAGDLSTHAAINVASTNFVLDCYPFPNHGWRISPGLLIHNPEVGAGMVPLGNQQNGGPFIANGNTYYARAPFTASQPDALAPQNEQANVYEGVKLPHTAFTVTTGWGNMIPRGKSGRWSFPVELGVAFLGSPKMSSDGYLGTVCDAQGNNCVAISQDQQLQADLKSQFDQHKGQWSLLKTYPIISFGMAYNFNWRAIPSDY